jgi:hypothetical protein
MAIKIRKNVEVTAKEISDLVNQSDLDVIEYRTDSFSDLGQVNNLLRQSEKYTLRAGMSFSDDNQRYYFLHVSRRT